MRRRAPVLALLAVLAACQTVDPDTVRHEPPEPCHCYRLKERQEEEATIAAFTRAMGRSPSSMREVWEWERIRLVGEVRLVRAGTLSALEEYRNLAGRYPKNLADLRQVGWGSLDARIECPLVHRKGDGWPIYVVSADGQSYTLGVGLSFLRWGYMGCNLRQEHILTSPIGPAMEDPDLGPGRKPDWTVKAWSIWVLN